MKDLKDLGCISDDVANTSAQENLTKNDKNSDRLH